MKVLSGKFEEKLFKYLVESSYPANKPHLFTVTSWLSVISSVGLGLHLEPNVYQAALRWWLGLNTSGGVMCPFCPKTSLDSLDHHAMTCRHVGDVVIGHTLMRESIADLCHRAHLGVGLEKGKGLLGIITLLHS